jgi:SAM-dependent methyltransferase
MTQDHKGPVNSGLSPKQGWRPRLFAKAMAEQGTLHERLIAPYKRQLLTDLRGDVLEIGPGTGANFQYYPADIRWIGVEPNPYMEKYLRDAAQGRTIELRMGYSEALPVADESMDVVVTTLVLCSVQDLARSLAEIRRVLRPGGKYLFIEHVAAPQGSGLRRLQNWTTPLWSFFADGCHPNREVWRALEDAGFSHLEITHFDLHVPVVKPHIAGVALK